MLPGQCPFYTMTSDDTMLMRESATRFIPTIPIIQLIPLDRRIIPNQFW
jgi:hypothetical protein